MNAYGMGVLRFFERLLRKMQPLRHVRVFGVPYCPLPPRISLILAKRILRDFSQTSGITKPRILLSLNSMPSLDSTTLYLPASTGRMGNGLVQVGSVLTYAKQLGNRPVIINADFPLLRQGMTNVDGLQVLVGKSSEGLSRRSLGPTHSDSILVADWFYSSLSLPGKDISPGLSVAQSLLEIEFISGLPEVEELLIHYRVGDIFSDRPHPAYGPPPHAFFELVVSHLGVRNVRVIAEDFSDSLTGQLIERLSSLASVSAELLSLVEDVKLLLSGKTLALSVGTFALTIAGLSQNIRSLYHFGSPPLVSIDPSKIFIVSDDLGHYVRDVRSNNWMNSPEQRALVANYSVDNLSIRAR